MKIPVWLEITNGIITDIHRSNTEQPDMIKAPWNCNAVIGEKIEWYDENYIRILDSILIKKGIRIDNRGWYYNINNTSQTLQIVNLDVHVPENFVKI